MVALHMTSTVAGALANAIKPLVRDDGTFDLVDTRMHNLVEHDRSFTRLDFRHGDNYTMQPRSKASPNHRSAPLPTHLFPFFRPRFPY